MGRNRLQNLSFKIFMYPPDTALPFSNFLKEMVSGSKLKCPSKVSWEVSFSLYYSVICSNCLGNVLVGTKNVEKCGKNVEKCEKCAKMC